MPIPRHGGSRASKPVTSARQAPKMQILMSSRRTSPLVFDWTQMIVNRLFCFFCQSVDFSGSESEGHGASHFLVTRNEIKKPV
jgi:hypothetical protein